MEEAVQGPALLGGGLPLGLHEVPVLGGDDAIARSSGPERRVQLLEAKVGEGRAAGKPEDRHGGDSIAVEPGAVVVLAG